MICGGDEIGRSQGGNNNAYCQDNEISWYNWKLDGNARALLAFTQRLIELRKEHPNLRRQKFFQDRRIDPRRASVEDIAGRHIQDLSWIRPDGQEMTEEEWNLGWIRCLGLQLSGKMLDHVDALGQRVHDKTFLICLNPHWESIDFYLPKTQEEKGWCLLLDTRTAEKPESLQFPAGEPYRLVPRSLAVFTEIEDET
jgi:glycogen operon protein